MKLISFVGGGARGLISAEILRFFQEKNGMKIGKDTILAGTSTGAIIVALLAKGYDAKQIVDFYKDYGANIFDKEFMRFGLTRSKYDDSELNRLLKDHLGNTTLGELWKRGIHIVIPVYNATNRERMIFRSSMQKYHGAKLRDVVRASASAPTYFDPFIMNGCAMIDGGVVVNNPTKVAHTDARRCGKDVKNILCIGTGRKEEPISAKQLSKGILANIEVLVDILLAEQDKTTDFQMREDVDLFQYEYVRIDPQLNHSSGDIDDFSEANILNMLLDAQEAV